MHEAALASAALPAPTAVLGLLLKPYSVGHELFLIREGNAIVVGGRPTQAADLAQAVLICCNSWEENRRVYRDRLLSLKLWVWRWRIRGTDFLAELECFRKYLIDGRREFPESPTTTKDNGGRRLGSPFLLRLHLFLTTKLGLGQAEAWDYPFGLAVMQWEAYYETDGGLNVMNDVEAAHMEHVARMEAEEAKKCQA